MKFKFLLLTLFICGSITGADSEKKHSDSCSSNSSQKPAQTKLPDAFYSERTFHQGQKITEVIQSIVNRLKQNGSIASGEVIAFATNAPVAPDQKIAPYGFHNLPCTTCTSQGLMLTVDDAGNHFLASVWGLSQITSNMSYRGENWEEPSARFDKEIINAFDLRTNTKNRPFLLKKSFYNNSFSINTIDGLGIQEASSGTSDYLPTDRTAAWETTKKKTVRAKKNKKK